MAKQSHSNPGSLDPLRELLQELDQYERLVQKSEADFEELELRHGHPLWEAVHTCRPFVQTLSH